MKKWNLTNWLLMCALALVGLFATPSTLAADKIVLKDGTILTGAIVRESSGIVWIKTNVGGIETERMVLPDEVKSVDRDAGKADAKADAKEDALAGDEAAAGAASVLEGDEPEYKPGVPRALVLTLGDEQNGHMVGVFMTADIIRRSIPTLEKELGTDRTGILVLRVHSGGGMLLELQKLSDVIENELKPRFRVVGWIDHAISAAAMTMHCVEEIYFTTDGEYGGCTGFRGGADKPMEGFELEEVLYMMEKISARGKHDPLLMRSMQIQMPLSATIDENGVVRYFGDANSGEIVVNPEREVLTLNALSAEKIKFSSGRADSIEELARHMGLPEVQWVGKRVRGYPWPISKAEEMQIRFREQTKEDQAAEGRLWASYERRLAAAQAAQERDRAGFVGQARQNLERIKAIFRNNPNLKLLRFGGDRPYREWLDEQERILRDLLK
jgi:hypothetical protein